ncbi:hypothetical protein HPL003_14530 [Paenibacillus terrae HPL-003]|uniref:Uncharacterized protein n=1 Tax=Paenibacillus terrae (strain HPL-003) TaxID=985665 RepID=G7W273_PAETH|nr:hypothetical protein HPL003_14530 [Paenibacillus terrae HPL-003]
MVKKGSIGVYQVHTALFLSLLQKKDKKCSPYANIDMPRHFRKGMKNRDWRSWEKDIHIVSAIINPLCSKDRFITPQVSFTVFLARVYDSRRNFK